MNRTEPPAPEGDTQGTDTPRALPVKVPLARAMVDMLARHWRVLIGLMKDLKLHDARSRTALWLARQVEGKPDGVVHLDEAKAVLARRLGMTPESLSRTLAALEAEGTIRTRGQSIDVLDAEALGGRQG